MPYVIRAIDKPDSAALRIETRPAHLEYIESFTSRVLAAGGFLEDDGSMGAGSLIILDTEDRAEAERFAAEDPYTRAGLFAEVEITRWRKVFFGGERT